MHCHIDTVRICRIWEQAVIDMVDDFRIAPHDHIEAGKIFVPWIHEFWVNPRPKLEKTVARDFQLMFWVRFGPGIYSDFLLGRD